MSHLQYQDTLAPFPATQPVTLNNPLIIYLLVPYQYPYNPSFSPLTSHFSPLASHLSPPPYNTTAAITPSTPPSTPAPTFAALPLKGVAVAVALVTTLVPVAFVVVDEETIVKFAQVRRVLLLVWITMDLSP